jgi:hypothetical protein
MIPVQPNPNLRYVTNNSGETTDVIVPIQLWEQIVQYLESESGIKWIDEHESSDQLLADLQSSLQEVLTGKTYPIDQLWNKE